MEIGREELKARKWLYRHRLEEVTGQP